MTIIQLTPDEIRQLINDSVAEAMKSVSFTPPPNPEPEYLSLQQAAALLCLKPATLYNYVFNRKIAFIKRNGKLIFKRADLTAWLEQSRHSTTQELKEVGI